jgi:transcription elongation factor Elf1
MKIVKLYAKANRQHICPECNQLLLSCTQVAKNRGTIRHLHCENIRLLHSAGLRWIYKTLGDLYVRSK